MEKGKCEVCGIPGREVGRYEVCFKKITKYICDECIGREICPQCNGKGKIGVYSGPKGTSSSTCDCCSGTGKWDYSRAVLINEAE